MNPIVNIVAYQVLCCSLVLGAGQGLDVFGLGLLLAWLPIHARLSDEPGKDFALFAVLVVVGPLLDTSFIQSGLVSYAGAAPWEGFAPYWIIAMWGTFALSLRHSLRWVMQNPLVAVLFGSVGAPLAYLSGVQFGAAELQAPLWAAWGAIAVGWALLLTLLRWPLQAAKAIHHEKL